ncbi:hypothetical protein OROMI_022624 [Orobanche minor]
MTTMFSPRFSKFFLLLALFVVFQEPALAIKKSYIVYLGEHNHGPDVTSVDLRRVRDSHTELLTSFLGSEEKAKDSIFYSYKRNINGFAAILEEEEAAQIAKHPDVVSVLPNQGRKLHTTHSWDFLMLERDGLVHRSSLMEKARYGEDTIIATLDSGVWPESKSFSNIGFGPIPSKWTGICEFEGHTSSHLCNRKLIGARYFNKGYLAYTGKLNSSSSFSTRDTDGHGTHTLSTAAGNSVSGANVFGIGNGTAIGGSPKARAAAYKVCWPPIDGNECFDADIMEAFDLAIDDGVDVLSVSLGGAAGDYFDDGIAIASFHAVKKGIVVIASAGNDGPAAGTVSNTAPWIITVGASTTDRTFEAKVVLKNGRSIAGTSLSKPFPETNYYPLISSALAKAANASVANATLCKENTLDPDLVKGKIIVCLRGDNARVEKGVVAAQAGAAGMILCNDESTGNEIISDPHLLPATHINYKDGLDLLAYVNNTKYPEGSITPPKVKLNKKPAPFMAAFSSRGPNPITNEILKPDITAPGVDIIASYSEVSSPADSPADDRRTPFNALSGTSMSCPHVSGVVGLLKTLYPDWSPAAIKSAIMTTAGRLDNTVNPMVDADYSEATPFDYGSGHIRPNRAMDPGLVYDLTVDDYLDFLCGLGYNETMIGRFSNSSHYDCPANYNVLNFNYPTITVPKLSGSVTVTRKLKNVGQPGKYTSRVRQPSRFSVSVEPNEVKFKKIGEEKVFKVTIKRGSGVSNGYSFGELLWSDGKHDVRSPIVVAAAASH